MALGLGGFFFNHHHKSLFHSVMDWLEYTFPHLCLQNEDEVRLPHCSG